jgi:uncharacterized protein (DUF433 family)
MSTTIELSSMLVRDPNHRGGRPSISGTGVSVDRVAVLYSQGTSPEEIGERFDLTLPQVYAALAFYLANREAIDADIDAQDKETLRIAEEWRAQGRRS